MDKIKFYAISMGVHLLLSLFIGAFKLAHPKPNRMSVLWELVGREDAKPIPVANPAVQPQSAPPVMRQLAMPTTMIDHREEDVDEFEQ